MLYEVITDLFEKAKKYGFSDMQLAYLSGGLTDKQIEQKRKDLGIVPVYKLVDTCAAEFRAVTPYDYSTYESECEARVADRKKVIVITSYSIHYTKLYDTGIHQFIYRNDP